MRCHMLFCLLMWACACVLLLCSTRMGLRFLFVCCRAPCNHAVLVQLAEVSLFTDTRYALVPQSVFPCCSLFLCLSRLFVTASPPLPSRRMFERSVCNPCRSFDEIPEASVCDPKDNHCDIVNPIEYAKHGETPAELENSFFQRAKELLGMAKV